MNFDMTLERDERNRPPVVVVNPWDLTTTFTCMQTQCPRKDRLLHFQRTDGWPFEPPAGFCLTCGTLYLLPAQKETLGKLDAQAEQTWFEAVDKVWVRATRALPLDFLEPLFVFPTAPLKKLLFDAA